MSEIVTPLLVSLRAASYATVIVTVLGVALGYLLARTRVPGRGLVAAVATLPVALPPTVVGYYLLTTLGGPGPVKSLSERLFGHELTFTFTGIVIAQTVEALPYCLRASSAAIAGVDPRLEQAARTMGLPGWRVTLQVTIPLARTGILAGVGMSFGRALGDYGATLAVSNGPRSTTLPIELANQVFNGSPAAASHLAVIQIGMAVAILVGVSQLRSRQELALAR